MTGPEFSLRRATATDAPALWAVRTKAILETCRGHYPDELLERWARSPMPESFPGDIEGGYCVVAITDGWIAGFAERRAKTGEVQALFVAPGMGRRGLGRQLLANLEADALEMGIGRLGLHASLNAVPFYRAAGYRSISEGTYTTSAGVELACVRMEKPLNQAGS